ncbi:hypothetical protein Droror1_Dr00003261 [Drosera rotundifolia]
MGVLMTWRVGSAKNTNLCGALCSGVETCEVRAMCVESSGSVDEHLADVNNSDKASVVRSKHSMTEQRRRSKINERQRVGGGMTRGVKPSNFTLSSLAKVVSCARRGKDIHAYMLRNGDFWGNVVIGNALIESILTCSLVPLPDFLSVEAAQPLSSLGMALPDLYIGKAAMSLSDLFGYPSLHIDRDCIDTNGVLGSVALVVEESDDIANTYFDTPFRRRYYDVNSYTDLMSNSASSFVQLIVPIGVGVAIGGFADNAFPVAYAPAFVVVCLISHPNVLNAAMIYWPIESVIYVEGYVLDRFAKGSWSLQSVHRNKVCWVGGDVVMDNEDDLLLGHLQVADAARASLGLPIVEYVVTDDCLKDGSLPEVVSGNNPEANEDGQSTDMEAVDIKLKCSHRPLTVEAVGHRGGGVSGQMMDEATIKGIA